MEQQSIGPTYVRQLHHASAVSRILCTWEYTAISPIQARSEGTYIIQGQVFVYSFILGSLVPHRKTAPYPSSSIPPSFPSTAPLIFPLFPLSPIHFPAFILVLPHTLPPTPSAARYIRARRTRSAPRPQTFKSISRFGQDFLDPCLPPATPALVQSQLHAGDGFESPPPLSPLLLVPCAEPIHPHAISSRFYCPVEHFHWKLDARCVRTAEQKPPAPSIHPRGRACVQNRKTGHTPHTPNQPHTKKKKKLHTVTARITSTIQDKTTDQTTSKHTEAAILQTRYFRPGKEWTDSTCGGLFMARSHNYYNSQSLHKP